ncbi:MAG: DUF4468 domain-containing protein [Prevotella sp.]|jgi:hypothetical protein|nr:DUF4468 domain-containing protein [Prevotella sp.]
MKKYILSLIATSFAMISFAQNPLSFSQVISEEGIDAQTLYDLTKNWMAQTFKDSNTFFEQSGEEITGRGRMTFSTNMQYSSIKGFIEYSINVQFKDGRLKLTIGSFTHKPEIVAYFNNDMGILVDSLPKKLEDMGITGVNRKACYKYYFKRGVPLCKAEFDKLTANLKLFIDNRNSTKEDW